MIPIVKTKQKKILEKSIEIALGSSSHGIPNMFRNDKTCLKLMWIMLFLMGTSMGIYTVVNSIFSYFSYDVVTSINVINEINNRLFIGGHGLCNGVCHTSGCSVSN